MKIANGRKLYSPFRREEREEEKKLMAKKRSVMTLKLML